MVQLEEGWEHGCWSSWVQRQQEGGQFSEFDVLVYSFIDVIVGQAYTRCSTREPYCQPSQQD